LKTKNKCNMKFFETKIETKHAQIFNHFLQILFLNIAHLDRCSDETQTHYTKYQKSHREQITFFSFSYLTTQH